VGTLTKEQIYEAILLEGSENDVIVEKPFIDFGACTRQRLPDPQGVSVANRTEGKITCFWVTVINPETKYSIFMLLPIFLGNQFLK
jgi:hypothetical protein